MSAQYVLFAVVSLVALAVGLLILRRFGLLFSGTKTKKPITVKLGGLGDRLSKVFSRGGLDGEFWGELESTLVEADVGVVCTSRLLEGAAHEPTPSAVKYNIVSQMKQMLSIEKKSSEASPFVIMVVGVNGVGKTTTIAKLAKAHIDEGRKVLLVAGDTYRAAAVEQLKVWGERLNVDVVSQSSGADSAAVIFDGIEKAKARNVDVVIADTAGRLHTKQNLMDELKKVCRVAGKAMPNAPHEKLIVIDATVGANGLVQAREFHQAIGLTGVVVTKLDGTAKGGIVLAVASELQLPITHVGVGEGISDLLSFKADDFVSSIFSTSPDLPV